MVAPSTILFEVCGKNGEPLDHDTTTWEASSNMERSENGGTQKWLIYIGKAYLVGGVNPSEKYEFVSWEYDIPNWMESHQIPWFQTTSNHQPAIEMDENWGYPQF